MTVWAIAARHRKASRRSLSVVERAVQAAVAAARPGVKASVVDRAARENIAAAGYGDRFLHRTGHGLGIDVHERPYITATAMSCYSPATSFPSSRHLSHRSLRRAAGRNRHPGPNGAEVLSELPRKPFHVEA